MVMPAAAFPVLMFVFVLMLAFIVVVVTAMAVPVFVLVLVLIVVVVAAVAVFALVFVLVLIVVMMFKGVLFELFHLLGESVAVLHGGEYFAARELLPGRGDERRPGVVFAHELRRPFKFFFARNVGMGEDYAVCRLYLVVEKFAEILHIHLALGGVHNCRVGVYGAVL